MIRQCEPAESEEIYEVINDAASAYSGVIAADCWKAATWAIRSYERHGFRLVPAAQKDELLRRYWTVPDRQIEELNPSSAAG